MLFQLFYRTNVPAVAYAPASKQARPLPLVPWSTSRADRPKYFSINELLPVRDLVIELNEFRARSVTLLR